MNKEAMIILISIIALALIFWWMSHRGPSENDILVLIRYAESKGYNTFEGTPDALVIARLRKLTKKEFKELSDIMHKEESNITEKAKQRLVYLLNKYKSS